MENCQSKNDFANSTSKDEMNLATARRTFPLGSNVLVKPNNGGVVRFVGNLKQLGEAGIWIGVEFLKDGIGRADFDGCVRGVRIFKCPKGRGALVRTQLVIKLRGNAGNQRTSTNTAKAGNKQSFRSNHSCNGKV